MDAITRYNKKWDQGNEKPLCVLIGGAAGTGKSTLLQEISALFAPGTVVSTGTIRAILRTVISKEQNPFLFEQTFTVHSVPNSVDVIEGYKKQCEPILHSVDKLLEFAAMEKQHHFIEGSHLHPRTYPKISDITIQELYLCVSDKNQYKEMLSGPTHNRTLSRKDFDTCLRIHDFVIGEAHRYNKPLLDISKETNLLNAALAHLEVTLT